MKMRRKKVYRRQNDRGRLCLSGCGRKRGKERVRDWRRVIRLSGDWLLSNPDLVDWQSPESRCVCRVGCVWEELSRIHDNVLLHFFTPSETPFTFMLLIALALLFQNSFQLQKTHTQQNFYVSPSIFFPSAVFLCLLFSHNL